MPLCEPLHCRAPANKLRLGRVVFLQRLDGILQRYDNRYISDSAVADAAAKALRGLVQPAA